MYRSFEIKNFRCFDHLNLTDLARVNLIAGANNVGKTALLEALFLHCGAYNPELTLRLNAFRGILEVKVSVARQDESLWDSLFYQFDTSKKIELSGDNTVTRRRVLRLKVVHAPAESLVQRRPEDARQASRIAGVSRALQTLELEYEEDKHKGKCILSLDQSGVLRMEPAPPPPPFPAFFQSASVQIAHSEDAERFSNMEIQGKQDVITQILRLIEPRLKRLAVAAVSGTPMLYGDVGMGRMLPLALMGGGMVRLASLALHIGNAPKGIVLVDEVENGLHHSILPRVWRAIGEAAREFDTQVFATTHSLECIVAAHRAFSEMDCYDFRLHRLEKVNGVICAITYDRETLEAALAVGLEVR